MASVRYWDCRKVGRNTFMVNVQANYLAHMLKQLLQCIECSAYTRQAYSVENNGHR
jgi:hypothetical protein